MAKKNAFMSKFDEKQQATMQSAAEKHGLDLSKLQQILEIAGEMAPVFFSAVMRLLDLLKQSADGVEKVYGSHDECPAELASALCDNEQAALEALCCAMCARHIACCDHSPEE